MKTQKNYHQIKATSLKLIILSFIISSAMMACRSTVSKKEEAAEKLQVAKNNFDSAQKQYNNEVITYRRESAEKMTSNAKNLNTFKTELQERRDQARIDYQKRIAILEQENTELETRMDNFKDSSKADWKQFKEKFDNDLNKLEKSVKDLTAKHKK